ncbi:hypothetical Protein YC6258_01590 [Gynuella sunshinyii YC6258]|uniref:Uncharacterized protein n=1 Tax=Gynuella sunshinyii YC6258 TaxID=1445510 RepID=A0A0C5VJS9_9GAMM|nr:hypothetical Protein YC6258_01590 [Gynuella sunshinyii YC6258]
MSAFILPLLMPESIKSRIFEHQINNWCQKASNLTLYYSVDCYIYGCSLTDVWYCGATSAVLKNKGNHTE